ncbi:hypothetical protein BDB00DRAFT_975394 [Zychaea mexicana]|uniref:uncharacterized protein n=1 Tax=Zychaea mexicana TaxID=64656 RepID=UPI0022FEE421|nr:uncharacterized protein BDB00DRAFT_975394 [Zychaea mexicana]KAI9493718.1 hypothetical protein BDB00DRAFT_975394 [Zychaea mexicana]
MHLKMLFAADETKKRAGLRTTTVYVFSLVLKAFSFLCHMHSARQSDTERVNPWVHHYKPFIFLFSDSLRHNKPSSMR